MSVGRGCGDCMGTGCPTCEPGGIWNPLPKKIYNVDKYISLKKQQKNIETEISGIEYNLKSNIWNILQEYNNILTKQKCLGHLQLSEDTEVEILEVNKDNFTVSITDPFQPETKVTLPTEILNLPVNWKVKLLHHLQDKIKLMQEEKDEYLQYLKLKRKYENNKYLLLHK